MNDLAAGRVDGEESSPSTLTDAVQSARQAAATGTAASGEQVATSAAEIPLSGEGDGDLKATASAKAKNPINRNQRENASSKKKRGVCPRCDRPSLSACICEALPASAARIELQRSHCFVLQHPHERKCKNRSLPFVELCLDPGCITVSVGRRFKNNCSASSDDDPAATMQHKLLNNDKPVWLLSPREGAISLTQAIKEQQNKEQKITVLVLDGTWKYSHEMDRANIEHDCYPKHMLRVKLTEQDFPTTFKPRRFDIRTPPTDQHLSTAECLAWVLSRIEDDDNRIYDAIMKPLDLMVRQWHSFSDRKTDAVDRRSNKKQKKRQQSALLQNDDVVAAAEENDGSSKRTRELGIADECSGES